LGYKSALDELAKEILILGIFIFSGETFLKEYATKGLEFSIIFSFNYLSTKLFII
jgi:hypothetical protein